MNTMSRLFPVVVLAALATSASAQSRGVSVNVGGVSVAVAENSSSSFRRTSPTKSMRRQADTALASAQRVLADGDYREAAQLFGRVAERYPRSTQAAEALYWRAYVALQDRQRQQPLRLH